MRIHLRRALFASSKQKLLFQQQSSRYGTGTSTGTRRAALCRFCNDSSSSLSPVRQKRCFKSTLASVSAAAPTATPQLSANRILSVTDQENHHTEKDSSLLIQERQRLRQIRNVGVFAHVDAGKTTVTERMLALAGVVREAGSVDDGNTVTDYLPAERERGITIQSAAISFPWAWHNSNCDSNTQHEDANDHVTIQLIDTPGHVDFSVEVNRSVAVLDGAVLVVDSVAGVQAQTETVWRAMTRPSLNNHQSQQHVQRFGQHEPLPCIAVINKMDKDGCNFGNAIRSLKQKLPGCNPIPIQLPLFRTGRNAGSSATPLAGLEAVSVDDTNMGGDFVGVVDLVHMRAIVWPEVSNVADVELCIPRITLLSSQPPDCPVTATARVARRELLESLAECDETMEEYYLASTGNDDDDGDDEPSPSEVRAALRRITLQQKGIPVLASAALRGKGVEPVLDCIADLLPSPLDRLPPLLTCLNTSSSSRSKNNETAAVPVYRHTRDDSHSAGSSSAAHLGHPLHPSLLALAFKVVHIKGRGGSGDGRVVFARVYSGQLNDRDVVQVVSPPAPGEAPGPPRKERIGGMLELAGGRFENMVNGICKSGQVCALVGLKGVATGDTIMMIPDKRANKKKNKKGAAGDDNLLCLTGVASPKPVLKVRLETESSEHQKDLLRALELLAIEDPSLVVEETESATLLSGLGELHIEVTIDRLFREFGIAVMVGKPLVSYRETITDPLKSIGLVNYDRTVAGTRLQAAVALVLSPTRNPACDNDDSSCMLLAEPIVTVSQEVREFLRLDHETPDDELMVKSEVFKSLVQGCQGALKRGPLGPHNMANLQCHVTAVDANEGIGGLLALPGALRAAAAHAVTSTLFENKDFCKMLEPTMSLEVTLPNDMVGSVLSDLTGGRRGNIEEVMVGESIGGIMSKALIRGDVPLVEILGYAKSLRSLTGGEASFSAEYKGHSPCDVGV